VNIFAGIARCDVIALGLIKGLSTLGMKKPIVLRLKGSMVDEVYLLFYIGQAAY
jgi:succinyl-CoA synthetase beta subunit